MLFACGETEDDEKDMADGFKMEAVVTDLGERMAVDVTESEYAEGPFWIITSDKTEFLDKDGNKISSSEIKVGDSVVIVYNGQVMMSYPPQVAALEIRKK